MPDPLAYLVAFLVWVLWFHIRLNPCPPDCRVTTASLLATRFPPLTLCASSPGVSAQLPHSRLHAGEFIVT